MKTELLNDTRAVFTSASSITSAFLVDYTVLYNNYPPSTFDSNNKDLIRIIGSQPF